MTAKEYRRRSVVNAVCPYFTMFPIDFPRKLLDSSSGGDVVLDPFCGRGTTILAARLAGLESVGIDSSPVAAAIARSKLLSVSPESVVDCAREILADSSADDLVPPGQFWELCYAPRTLRSICRLRSGLLGDNVSPEKTALTAIILGGLHGPYSAKSQWYFSNQMPRTFASKPAYSVRYWLRHDMKPHEVDVLDLIRRRAFRYLSAEMPAGKGKIIQGDSRGLLALTDHAEFNWIITSPPYYGLRTYVPDQWLRMWFLGGESDVKYRGWTQLRHSSPDDFATDLAKVWKNCALRSARGAKLVIRFGGISDRTASPDEVLKDSIRRSGSWRLTTSVCALTALAGRRQSPQFSRGSKDPAPERDYYLKLNTEPQ